MPHKIWGFHDSEDSYSIHLQITKCCNTKGLSREVFLYHWLYPILMLLCTPQISVDMNSGLYVWDLWQAEWHWDIVPSQLSVHSFSICSHQSVMLWQCHFSLKWQECIIFFSCVSAGAWPTARVSVLFSGQWHDQILWPPAAGWVLPAECWVSANTTHTLCCAESHRSTVHREADYTSKFLTLLVVLDSRQSMWHVNLHACFYHYTQTVLRFSYRVSIHIHIQFLFS